MLDGADAIGEDGINRVTAWIDNGSLIPWKEDKKRKTKIERVKFLFNNPDKRTKKHRKQMKNKSVIEEVAYNYAFVKQIYDFLKKEGKISFVLTKR